VLTVAASSQSALLNGLRRIGDIARVSVASAVLSTALGIGALWLWGLQGLLVFVLVIPVSSFVMGHVYVARLPRLIAPRTPLPQLLGQWRAMARLGAAFMVAGAAVSLGQLAVRALIQRELGSEALGQFQAAWAISMTYVGFVLAAMGTDYYPRLTASISDHAAVNRMVNEQAEVALLLAGPVFLAMLALAPWVIGLLYSSQFAEAAVILRWQVLGDILKVAAWPMAFIILASGDGRTFMLTESLVIGVFAGLVWVGLPLLGVQATGLAFIGMYVVYLPMIYWLARRKTGFAWSSHVKRLLPALIAVSCGVCVLAKLSTWLGLGVGLPAAALFAAYGFTRLAHMANLSGPLRRVADICRNALIRMGMWHE
jgi:O-antigen/teichoic acid export membrane protein